VSYTSQTFIDAVRCAFVAAAALAIGWPLGRLEKGRPGAKSDLVRWSLLLAPLLTPALVVSYAFAPIALRLTGQPWALAAFYSTLLIFKLCPFAALARFFFPPPLSAEARFCERLAGDRSRIERCIFLARHFGPVIGATFAVLFLFAFADFELASLLSIKTWVVMHFDAHAGGLALADSLKRLAFPMLIELAVWLPIVFALKTPVGLRPECRSEKTTSLWFTALVALPCGVWPLLFVMAQAAVGLGTLRHQNVFAADLLVSVGFAAAATGFVWLMLGQIQSTRWRWLGALPGSLGALVLALTILAAVQRVPLLRDSPAPLLAAHLLLLMPFALILRGLLTARQPSACLHLARMAGSRRLLWELAVLPRFAATALLFAVAYFEFTAATILAPVGLTPVFVRLHNLAHYGQTPALSAMLSAAVLLPAMLLALTLSGARLYARRDAR
jgi:hypothetical protein